eukprot:1157842-Pelagomonas_calceolata.AAC.15
MPKRQKLLLFVCWCYTPAYSFGRALIRSDIHTSGIAFAWRPICSCRLCTRGPCHCTFPGHCQALMPWLMLQLLGQPEPQAASVQTGHHYCLCTLTAPAPGWAV